MFLVDTRSIRCFSSERFNTIAAWDGKFNIYFYKGYSSKYSWEGTYSEEELSNELYILSTNPGDDEFSSGQTENIWIWSFMKNIFANEMIFTVDKLYTAWIKDSFDLYIQDVENMEAHKCYIGPQTEGKTNHCVRQDTLTETCEDMFEDKLVCSRSLQVYPKPVTLNCNIQISQHVTTDSYTAARKITMGDEIRPIGKWVIEIEENKFWKGYTFWFFDWKTIDTRYGSGFLK